MREEDSNLKTGMLFFRLTGALVAVAMVWGITEAIQYYAYLNSRM